MKITIQNRHGLNIVLKYTQVDHAKGLAFLQHGFGGFKEQSHILAMAETFHKNGISTVNFDATHSFGESGGDLVHATITNHYHDLVDVVQWAMSEPWFQSPFYLAGHSLGGATTLNYALNHPQHVKGVAPTSAVVSGKLWKETKSESYLKNWQEKGFYEKKSSSKPGVKGHASWGLMEDAQRYDLSVGIENLRMPALFVVGDEDVTTTPAHQKLLYGKWGGEKMYHEIQGCGHTFRSPDELAELRTVLDQWLLKVN